MAKLKSPMQLMILPSKDALAAEFVGKRLIDLRTPALVIDRAVFARNCAAMRTRAQRWGATFRAHLKTHKTAEGAKLQLDSTSTAVVVSTIMEAWQVEQSGLIADGTIKDILYGLPISPNKIEDLSELKCRIAEHNAVVRLLIDHIDQVSALETFASQHADAIPSSTWSVFLKVDGGQKRAGIPPSSAEFKELVSRIFTSTIVKLYGFYSHAGDSYGSTSTEDASKFLGGEVASANDAAKVAMSLLSESNFLAEKYQEPFVLSVGSTPTAHAASGELRGFLENTLLGKLELHAGNYPMLDLQQMHTGLIDPESIAQKVLATVVSYYPGRGSDGGDEALCDAGAIAMSKDTGPSGGFGEVLGRPWKLGRISQEHGILTHNIRGSRLTKLNTDIDSKPLRIGDQIEIVGQHACLTAAAYPWYYIVDSSVGPAEVVVDIWVPWKGW